MEKYPQKLVSLSSTSIPIKKKKLHLPRFCSCHSEEKEQIKLNIQKTLKWTKKTVIWCFNLKKNNIQLSLS